MEEYIDKLLAKINTQPHSAALVALEGLLKSFKKIVMEVEADERQARGNPQEASDEVQS